MLIFLSASREIFFGRLDACRLPRPEVRGQRALLVDQLERALRVVDRRFDLAAMADDAGVLQQPLHVTRAERATAAGSKSLNALRKFSRLRRMVIQLRPD